MSERKNRRIFWFEGVTRGEVERSLGDRSPSRLRQQGPRRALVMGVALVRAGLALTLFIPHPKVGTYSEFALMIVALGLYFRLRKAVRMVSDAPSELLDERQIALRDASYTVAYRILAIASVVYLALTIAVGPEGVLHAHAREGFWLPMALSYLMCYACLPAMVLAWNMPSEMQDEPSDESPAGTP